jgi:hypothetical protein
MASAIRLTVVAAFLLAGCATPISTEPVAIGEPTPGSFHLKAQPQTAPQALSIRVDDGTPSHWSEEVPVGAPVWVFMTTLPEESLGIWVNGVTCEGRFDVKARFETDVLLTMTETGCSIGVVGLHREGAIEHQYVPEAT